MSVTIFPTLTWTPLPLLSTTRVDQVPYFAPVTGAKTYDVWVSTYADGRGAVLLGKDWTAPGQLLTALSPNTDLYLFVVAREAAEKASRPGKHFKVNLKDMFPQR